MSFTVFRKFLSHSLAWSFGNASRRTCLSLDLSSAHFRTHADKKCPRVDLSRCTCSCGGFVSVDISLRIAQRTHVHDWVFLVESEAEFASERWQPMRSAAVPFESMARAQQGKSNTVLIYFTRSAPICLRGNGRNRRVPNGQRWCVPRINDYIAQT